jgi:PAS domain-containing protein
MQPPPDAHVGAAPSDSTNSMDPILATKFENIYQAFAVSKLLNNHSNPGAPRGQPQTLKIKAQALRESYVSPEELQKMASDVRRRYERNQREKQRSFKISKQIKDLQSVLTELHVPYKNNKCAVLTSAVSFIKEVQEENQRSLLHNNAMKRIISNSTMIAQERGGIDGSLSTGMTESGTSPSNHPDPHHAMRTNFTSGASRSKPLDYEAIFRCTLVPMGMVNGETGTILDCNDQFLSVSGHSEEGLIGKDIRTFLKEVTPEDREIRAENDKRLREIFGFTEEETMQGGLGGDMLGGRPETYHQGTDVSPLGGKKSQIVFPIMTRKRLRTLVSEENNSSSKSIVTPSSTSIPPPASASEQAPVTTSVPNFTTASASEFTSKSKTVASQDNPIGLNFSELVREEDETQPNKRKKSSTLFSFSVIQLKA